jgi:hypothetical protein
MAGAVVGQAPRCPVSSLVAQLDIQSFMGDDVGIVQSLTAKVDKIVARIEEAEQSLLEIFAQRHRT